MQNGLERRQERVEELNQILERKEYEYALRYMCDIAVDDRRAGYHVRARKMIDRACQLIRDHPEVPISWLYFENHEDCHQIYMTWRDDAHCGGLK